MLAEISSGMSLATLFLLITFCLMGNLGPLAKMVKQLCRVHYCHLAAIIPLIQ
jgi:hypothetical protein